MNRIHQVVGLASTLLRPGGASAFLQWKPFSITAFRMLTLMRREGLQFNTIVDGGANKGQFARAATETYPHAEIFAFEPLPEVADALKSNLADRPQIKVFAQALGSSDGTIDFYRHRYSHASSVLPPTDPAAQATVEKIEVPVRRLDDVLRDAALRPPILLKLDLQGYEIEAMRGATAILAKTDHVLLETSFVRSYAGEPTFPEVADFMREHGFEFLRPLDMLRDDAGSIVQMDALFGRTRPE